MAIMAYAWFFQWGTQAGDLAGYWDIIPGGAEHMTVASL